MADPKIGRDVAVVLGTTTYKATADSTANANLTPIIVSGKGSGDTADYPIVIGMNGTLNYTLLSTDLALLGFNGSVMTFAEMDDVTTVIGGIQAVIELTKAAELGGLVKFNLTVHPRAVPSQYTALAAL